MMEKPKSLSENEAEVILYRLWKQTYDLAKDHLLSNALEKARKSRRSVQIPSGLPLTFSALSISETTPSTFLAAEPAVTIISFALVVIFAIGFGTTLFLWNQTFEETGILSLNRIRTLCYVVSMSTFMFGLVWTIGVGILKLLAIQII